jgi:hypothetical protein
VLFIGNSYTYGNDLPGLVRALAVEAREPKLIETRTIGIPGATLKDHWEKGDARTTLRRGPWDFVVLQEHSTLPIENPASMARYVRLFDGEIKSQGARTILFVTWARENKPQMQAPLNNAYRALGRELGARVAPVGPAWQRALERDPLLPLYQSDHSHPTVTGSYVGACVFYSVIYDKPPTGLDLTPRGLARRNADIVHRAAWEEVQAFR